ncbi:MAG: HIT domain-containing protein [Gammaproteobacteria bacterium]|nr:HIT domain-containing protein [Gammaproteobacteria bacterium]
MEPAFQLHERLAADTVYVANWPLCAVLLMNDAQYPWVILVPRRAGLRELHELAPADQQQFLRESCHLGAHLLADLGGDKLNVAALGNLVPQLHIHHIVRRVGDAAWPAPVWGRHPPQAYTPEVLREVVAKVQTMVRSLPGGFEL